MTTMQEAFNKLKQDKVFQVWKEENKDSYLAHVFFETSNGDITYQVGYCNPDQTITTFIVTPDKISVTKPQEALKRPDTKIKSLTLEEVKTTLGEALETATSCQQEHYPNHKPLKKFIILQNLDQGQVYNITYVTQSMDTLNIKISAKDNSVVEHNTTQLVNFTKGGKQ